MKLTSKHDKAISLFLDGCNATQVAQQLKVTPRSVYRWLADPDFALEMTNRRAALRSEIVSTLHSKAQKAITTIEELMEDDKIPALVRLKAAQTILDKTIGSADIQELSEQVAALEKLINDAANYRNKG
jgi:hypothetical protein